MRHLEDLSANAWPGLRCVLVDGWAIRFADGYSRRANSVLPLYPGRGPLDARIARCEALMAREGLTPTFKLFPEAEPAGLDEELERRGYERQAETSVMVLEDLGPFRPEAPAGYELSATLRLEESWLGLYAGNGALDDRQRQAVRGILAHIVPERRHVLLTGADGPAACALAVVEDGWAGIFDVVVRQDLRGRGLGRRIMECALAEAAGLGARRSYLQVMEVNRTAVHLYVSMGYRVAYPYWYRVKGKAS